MSVIFTATDAQIEYLTFIQLLNDLLHALALLITTFVSVGRRILSSIRQSKQLVTYLPHILQLTVVILRWVIACIASRHRPIIRVHRAWLQRLPAKNHN